MTEALAVATPIDTKECPKCAETIKQKAIACRFCGHELINQPKEEKVYLEKPSRVTDKIVQFGNGDVTRIADITEVSSHSAPVGFYKTMAWLLLGAPVIGIFMFGWNGFIVGVVPMLFGFSFAVGAKNSSPGSIVCLTKGGSVLTGFNSKQDAQKVAAAINKSIAENS